MLFSHFSSRSRIYFGSPFPAVITVLLAFCLSLSALTPMAHAAPLKAGATVTKARLSSAQSILNRLRQANQVPDDVSGKTIKVIQSNTLNAATNGQGIIVTSALLNRLNSDDEQAFIISHELSHVLLNHIGKTQMRRMGFSLLDHYLLNRYAPNNALVQLAGDLGIGLLDKRSSRGYEYQADDLGIRLMRNANYDPRAALSVFSILKAASPASGTPEFLQDHPITDSRIRVLVSKYQL